jgi:membrane-associated phospholipid phosphatase
MRLAKLYIFLFSMFCLEQMQVYAQSDSILYPRLNKKYIVSCFSDTRDVAVSPVKWKAKDWLIFSSTLGTVALVSTQDLKVYDFFERNRNSTTQNISTYALEPWGSGVYSLGSMGLLFMGAKVFHNKKAEGAALTATKAFFLSSMFVTVAKQLIHRHRPYQVREDAIAGKGLFSQYIIDGPASNLSYTSFPSGHTNAIFAVASSISYTYRDKFWVPVLAYSIAGFSGVSRIHDRKHWASDVLMGAVSGWAIGRFVAKHNEWKYTPLIGVNNIGVLIDIN